jgi:hypothetical protein
VCCSHRLSLHVFSQIRRSCSPLTLGILSYCKLLSWVETCSEKDRKDLCAEGVRLRELSEGNEIFKGFHSKETGAELK